MRTTEEIKKDLWNITLGTDEEVQLELLLDIRDLLIRLNQVLDKSNED